MSALTVLYIILPFPLAFIIHMSIGEIAMYAMLGVVLMVVYLFFAHWIGMKVAQGENN